MKIWNNSHGQVIVTLNTDLDPAGVLVIQDIVISDSPSQGLTLHPQRDPAGFTSSEFGPQVTIAMAASSVNDMRNGLMQLYSGSVVGPAATATDTASANGPALNNLTASYNAGINLGAF